MSFFEEFRHAFFYNPAKALIALYWYVLRRRVRGRNQLRQISSQAPYVYSVWIRTVERLDEVVRQTPAEVARWKSRPTFTILMQVDEAQDAGALQAIVRSVERQSYQEWELLLVHDSAIAPVATQGSGRVRWVPCEGASDVVALRAGIMAAEGDYILPLGENAILSPAALFRFAQALQEQPDANIVYGDHDEQNERGERAMPWLKSAWNRELLLAQDYVSPSFVIRRDDARRFGGLPDAVEGAAAFSMVLEASAPAASHVVHVPHIVCHYPEGTGARAGAGLSARVEAVGRHIKPLGGSAKAGNFGLVEVSWSLPADPPLVSIIIPTRDQVELLRTCIESVLGLTSYPRIEIIIVDNGSVEPAARQYLAELVEDSRIRILTHDAPFNFSELNNLAAAEATGDFLCLLNNDTEVISGEWLDELMRYAVQDHVGAVGAKLLYPDGSIQHAGVVIGIGNAAGHAHRLLANEDAGYYARAHATHQVSAVTAACLVIAKRKFQAVGGLDAKNLKVAFNDVDFCLRIQAAGWTNIYCPRAVLVHHESKSRGSDSLKRNIKRYQEELAYLQKRWGTETCVDPAHHPNLDRASETYVLRL